MTFADRLFEELSAVDDGPDFNLICQAIGAMFQPVEDISRDQDDGSVGYGIVMDINRTPFIEWLAQFVGVRIRPDLDDVSQRAYVASTPGFARGRPAAVVGAARATLTGEDPTVILRERDGSAWRYTVITKPSQTPDPSLTLAALIDQKPGPDILTYETIEYADYEWVRENVASYAALKATYTHYSDLTNQEI